MKLLVVNNLWPHPYQAEQSANVVSYQLTEGLSRQPGLTVGFLKVNRPGYKDELTEAEAKSGIAGLQAVNVRVLEPVNLPANRPRRARWRQIFWPKIGDFYPEVVHRRLVEEAMVKFGPDIIFIPWSEWLTALCADIKIAKFAYYGNPDPKSALARLSFSYRHGEIGKLRFMVMRNLLARFEQLHLAEMNNYQLLGDVAANDAQYYIAQGHANAFYIQNLWVDRLGEAWRAERKLLVDSDQTPVIIGNIGNLGATANSYGLEYLAEEFLPALEKETMGQSFEIHILGPGKLHPAVKAKLENAKVKIRGFVPDIDKELLRCKVFLCLNNGTDYKVNHTRYLHAWSLGCCVIAHQDVRLSMPEVKNQKNALLGKDASEIARLVKEALSDRELRWRIGEGGYQTFKEFFTAEKVVPKIVQKIRQNLQED